MSSGPRPAKPGALDVRDCSTCGHAEWDGAAKYLGCNEAPESLMAAWIERSTFDDEGFPIDSKTNCPGWIPAWEE